VGRMAADRLRQMIADPEVEILAVHQLTPELMEPISRARRVIFIDAAVGAEPGEIAERRIEANSGSGAFTHQATPEALLAGARALYGAAPEATMFTISGAGFELGARLSEAAEKALETVLSRIASLSQAV
jgi:hydrogenase maturation protease